MATTRRENGYAAIQVEEVEGVDRPPKGGYQGQYMRGRGKPAIQVEEVEEVNQPSEGDATASTRWKNDQIGGWLC